MAKPPGAYARALGRVLGRKSRGNRYVRGSLAAASGTAKAGARAGRILWLEIVGSICAVFAVSLGAQLWRMYRERATVDHPYTHLAIAAVVLAIFLWFAVSSFWRARRLKRP